MFTEGRRNIARGALGLFAAGAALVASREEAKAQTVDALTKLDLPAGVDVEIKVE